MKKLLFKSGIAMFAACLCLNPLITIAQEEQNSQREEEGRGFNKTIQDIDSYFESLGSDIAEDFEAIDRFDRNLERLYEEYQDYENNNFAAMCNSFVEGGCPTLSNSDTNAIAEEMAMTFLETQLGVDRSTVSFLGNFFDVDVANGRISIKDYETIAENLLGIDVRGRKCPFSLRIIAGSCDDDIRLPIIVTKKSNEPREGNRSSGDLRDLSQPTHLLLDEYALHSEIEPNSKIQLANLYDREIARNVAYGFVEQRGQEWLGNNLLDDYILARENAEIYKQIGKISGESLNLSVTQDVMKVNTMINERLSHLILNQSIIATKNHASLLSLQQQTAYGMQLQANISDTLDRSLRFQQSQNEATSFMALNQPIYIPGFSY